MMGDSSRLYYAILNDYDGSGIDVLGCPVLLGLRYIYVHVSPMSAWTAAQRGEWGAEDGRTSCKKLQEAARSPTGETPRVDHCACGLSLACTQILLLLMEGSELPSSGRDEVACRVSRAENLSALSTWCFLPSPTRFSGVSRNEGSKDPEVYAEGCGRNSKERVTEGQCEG